MKIVRNGSKGVAKGTDELFTGSAFIDGDVVWIPAGVKHWHGATPDAIMMHIAIQEEVDGKTVEWLEKVSDEEYPEEI
ncbi:MAG: Transcriptional regulator [Methanosarcinales archeaon 56_1174]|nr:MAG: Transcriptional regulator [Methanosarcinales archeaon 56_1174]